MVDALDNIPVLSYFILKGRCRQCGASFSPRYMIVELLTGFAFLFVFIGTNPYGSEAFQWATFWYLAFTGLLIIGTFTDLDSWIIPDGITIWGTAVALVSALIIGLLDSMPILTQAGPFPVIRIDSNTDPFVLFSNLITGAKVLNYEGLWWEPFVNAVIGSAFGFFLLWGISIAGKVVFQKEAMGFGDVKLFALIGATLGVTGSMMTLFLACFIGAFVGGFGLLLGRLKPNRAEDLRRAPLPDYAKADSTALSPDQLADMTADEDSEESHDEENSPMAPKDDLTLKLLEAGGRSPGVSKVHHVPFGPSIALAAILILIFQDFIFSEVLVLLY